MLMFHLTKLQLDYYVHFFLREHAYLTVLLPYLLATLKNAVQSTIMGGRKLINHP